MFDSYLLVMGDEKIRCVGHLPHRAEEIFVVKRGESARAYRVTMVRHHMTILETPYDRLGSRGNVYNDLPEVYVEPV